VTADTELRDGPSRSAGVVAALPAGAVVTKTGPRVRRWLPVAHMGRSGWAAHRFLERVGGEPAGEWTEERVVAAIRAAARTHGQSEEDMVRVARCESVLDPRAVNPAGPYHGLFQFLPSTWATTPYADEDVFDPVANANAAAWMWQQGRRHEWACQ
jgi:hypothetical protein